MDVDSNIKLDVGVSHVNDSKSHKFDARTNLISSHLERTSSFNFDNIRPIKSSSV